MTQAVDLDPRTKFFIVACFSSCAVFLSDLTFLFGLFWASLLCLLWFRVSLRGMYKQTKTLLKIVLGIALLQSVFGPDGQVLLQVGSLPLLTSGGLLKAGEFVLRMLIIVASAGILSTSNSREIIQGLIQLKIPYEIAFMASMGIRFLPVLAEEIKDTLIAVQLRGVDLKALPFRQKLEVITSLFQPVAAGVLVKSKAISLSIEMRGFRAHPARTSYLVLKLKGKDYGVILGAGFLTVVISGWYFIRL